MNRRQSNFNVSLVLRSLICCSLLTVVLPVLTYGQTPFALENLGQKIDSHDARMTGRGSWGMAVFDSVNPGFLNIAGLSALRHVGLKFTGYGERVASDYADGSRKTFRTLTPDLRVGLPVIKGRLAVTAGFRVDRSMQYTTISDTLYDVGEENLVTKEEMVREGTIFEIPLGVAWRPIRQVALGGTLGMRRGTIKETFSQFFTEPTTLGGIPLFLTNARDQNDEFTGLATTYSLLWLGSGPLRFGTSYTPSHDLDVHRTVTLVGVGSRAKKEFTLRMPTELRAGLEFEFTDRWILGGDYQWQEFSRFSGSDEWSVALEDEETFSFGFERKSAHVRRGGWNNLPLRVGASFRHWAYQVGGAPIKEQTYSVGTGFPFPRQMGYLDMALSYSLIGDQAENGLESHVWRFTISVTGLERWW